MRRDSAQPVHGGDGHLPELLELRLAAAIRRFNVFVRVGWIGEAHGYLAAPVARGQRDARKPGAESR